jgi:hypothetical protein
LKSGVGRAEFLAPRINDWMAGTRVMAKLRLNFASPNMAGSNRVRGELLAP